MSRPDPTLVLHFTRVEHLAQIMREGLLADNVAQASEVVTHEVGHSEIKERRRRRQVPIGQGGTVADYAPFYFAPRSPMMSAIENGRVPGYTDGCHRVVYLVADLDQLVRADLNPIVTDRNATMRTAEFRIFSDGIAEDFIDWQLMTAAWWNNTEEFPDRRERRMAECLVWRRVPWDNFLGVATKSEAIRAEVETEMRRASTAVKPVVVKRSWYF